MKLIIVPSCSNCPNGAQWNIEGTEFMCSLARKINFNNKEIPEFCPLTDAKDFFKEIVDAVRKEKKQ